MYLLKADKILTGNGNEVIKDGFILVKNEKIIDIGNKYNLKYSEKKGLKEINLKGLTIMPGLIDCHVHLGLDGSKNPVENMKNSDDDTLFSLMIENAARLLKTGVTTVRDLGARSFLDVKLKSLISKNVIDGPNLIISNRPITSVHGHCWFMGGECKDTKDIKEMIQYHATKGADWIKIMATGGGLTEGTAMWDNQFSRDELEFAVHETHNLGKKIAAHAHGTSGINNVVDAGVDTIEHCSWFEDNNIKYDSNITQKIIEKNIYVCPTVNVKWESVVGRMEQRMPQLQEMKKKGVKFIAGTDSGITNVPHDAYVAGLETMKKIGMTNKEIIESATILAAEGLGIDKITGSLETGKLADIIAVKGDPYHDLSNLNNIKWVMSSGKIPRFFNKNV